MSARTQPAKPPDLTKPAPARWLSIPECPVCEQRVQLGEMVVYVGWPPHVPQHYPEGSCLL